MAADPVTAALNIGGQLIDRLWPDPATKAQAQLELLKLQQTGDLAVISGQLGINQTEAASSSVFVAGWRPFVGWICGAALGYTYLVYPMSLWALTVMAPHITPPRLGTSDMLYELLFAMLGLGGLRTVEKIKGVAS